MPVILLLSRSPISHRRGGATTRPFARGVLSAPPKQPLRNALSNLPWAFEPNVGQADTKVKFIARANDTTVFLTQRGVAVSWMARTTATRPAEVSQEPDGMLQLQFLGTKKRIHACGQSMLRGKTNYLLGRDPRKWLMDVPRYSSVEYRELYPGIDARFYGGQSGLEYDLVMAPGSSWRNVRLRVIGANATRLDRDGDLHFRVRQFRASPRQVVMHRPNIYQVDGGRRISVYGDYKLLTANVIGFVIGKHRADLPIVIDPSISITYTTFLGGSGAERGSGVAVDSAGAIYVGGTTTLAAFPETTAGSKRLLGGTSNLFIAKVDPAQSGAASLVYLTFVGGSKNDRGGMVAVDRSTTPPRLAVLGWSTSADFPVTDGSALNGLSDLTVTKLNAAGDGLIYSKYFGGSGAEATQNVGGIATDSAGNVFVTSDTASTDLPMAPAQNGFATAYGGGASDGFLAEFASGTGALMYSTYLGINAAVGSAGVAVDASGNAYVAGFTSSPVDFPTTKAFQQVYGGGAFDGFVMRINPNLGAHGLVYASLLGGSQSDQPTAIAVDTSVPATVYITGTTNSPDFIPATGVTNAAYQTMLKGSGNAFFAAISQTAAGAPSAAYESYLGGAGADTGSAIAVLSPTQVYVAGSTASGDFPARCSLQGFSGAQDAFLAEFNPTVGGKASLVEATFLGGSVTTEANAVAVNSLGGAIIFGDTMSHDYPLAANANNGFQPTCTSCATPTASADAMLTEVAAGTAPAACAAFNPAVVNFGALPIGAPSPPIDISLANGGDANLHVTGVTITGADSAAFSQMNTCLVNSPVAPGGNCGFAVTFTPSAVGVETATLQVADDGVGSPQTLTLTGTGASGEVTLSQTSLNFGNVAQGTKTGPSTSILTNTGNATLSVTNAKIAGSDATDFTFSGSNTCDVGASVLPGASCTIAVDFGPDEPNPPQDLTAQVEISFADTTSQSGGKAAVALSGTEAAAASPAVSLASTALDFGSVNVGGSTSQPPVLLKNTGGAALSITGIGIIGSNAGDFAETATCPVGTGSTLSPGASCTISVTFQPAAPGPRVANVMISDNANPSQQTIALSGTGAVASVSLTPASLTFAAQNEGPPPSAAQNATLKNTGASPLTISSISFGGANPNDFAQTNNCPLAPSATLNAGGICTISITFQPTGTGQRSAVLSVDDDSAPSPQTVAVSGTGTAPVAQVAPASLQFNSTVVGIASASQSIQVSNTGNGALVISGVSFGGADGGDFQASGSCLGSKGTNITVAAGGSCTLGVDFLPLAAGARTATLALNDNAGTNPSVALAGTATDFQMGPASGTTSATIAAGQTAAIGLQMTAVNGFTGTVTLGCTGAPPAGACSASPASVQISAATPVPFTVNVTTTTRGLILPVVRTRGQRRILPTTPVTAILLLVFAVSFFAGPRGGKSRVLRPILMVSLLLLASCGGGGTSAPSGTPAGTYTVQATATTGGTTRTLSLSVTVQ